MSIKRRGAASTGVYEGYKAPQFREQASHIGGRGEGKVLWADRQFLAFPMENVLAEAVAGFGVSLPMWCHCTVSWITAGNRLLMELLHQTKLLPPSCWLGMPGPCPCPSACAVPSILAGLHEQWWDYSESHGKLSSRLTVPVPIQRTSPDLHSSIVLPQKLQLAAKQGN